MSFLLKTVEDGVMKIVLNRPDAMNALNRDMMQGFHDALRIGYQTRPDIFASYYREQVGLLAYSPLAQGYLTGKYQRGARPPGARTTRFWSVPSLRRKFRSFSILSI